MEEQQLNPLPPSNEEQVIIRQSKDKLPKLDIPKGERLYISRKELSEIHEGYFGTLSDMAQAVGVNAEMLSLMQDAVSRAYVDELAETRHNNILENDVKWQLREQLNNILTPRSWRGLFFRRKRNQAQVLLDELTYRLSQQYLKRKQDELPCDTEGQTTEYVPYTVLLDNMAALLPRRMRKGKRAAWEAIMEALAASYESKAQEQQRNARELEEIKQELEQAKKRLTELEEINEQLINESEEVTDSEEQASGAQEETQAETQENGENEPDEASGGEDEEANTADEEDEDDLDYGELLEDDE